MPLSEEQLEEMYKASLKCSINLENIREQLDKGDDKFGEHGKRITQIETEQTLLKTKIGAVVIFLTLCATIIINSFGWVLTHLFSSKGGV